MWKNVCVVKCYLPQKATYVFGWIKSQVKHPQWTVASIAVLQSALHYIEIAIQNVFKHLPEELPLRVTTLFLWIVNIVRFKVIQPTLRTHFSAHL